MPENHRNVRPPQMPSRRPYEAPRLEVVRLQPEEQLLACFKIIPVILPCDSLPAVS